MRTLLTALIAAVMTIAAWSASAATFKPYTPEVFQSALTSGNPVVVHVHADWCPVCKRQIPILDSLLDEPDFRDVEAIRINFDVDRDVVARLNVRTQATLLVIRDGNITAASSYQTDPAVLRSELLSGL